MIVGSHVGTTVEETGMRAEDVLANEVAEYSSHDRVCGKFNPVTRVAETVADVP